MRGLRLAAIMLALGSCVLIQPVCYSLSADEAPGTTVTYKVQPFGCGPMNIYINCDGIPFELNGVPAGSTWLYTSTTVNGPYGWGFFFGSNDLAGAQFQIVDSSMNPSPATFSFNSLPPYPTIWPPVCNGNCTDFTAHIIGTSPDDGGSYTANVSLNIYYYKGCSSGRIGGCREIGLVTSGTISVTYR